jgi:hypothetical protein
LRIVVTGFLVCIDGLTEFFDAVEHTAADTFACEFAEPSLDEVLPRGTGVGMK